MNTRTTYPQDHRETSDTYRGEVFRQGAFRVVICNHRIQWIFQRQGISKTGAGGAWQAVGYCRQRATLMRLWRQHSGEEASLLLALLPERFSKPGAKA